MVNSKRKGTILKYTDEITIEVARAVIELFMCKLYNLSVGEKYDTSKFHKSIINLEVEYENGGLIADEIKLIERGYDL